jgi:hypothetical protein
MNTGQAKRESAVRDPCIQGARFIGVRGVIRSYYLGSRVNPANPACKRIVQWFPGGTGHEFQEWVSGSREDFIDPVS